MNKPHPIAHLKGSALTLIFLIVFIVSNPSLGFAADNVSRLNELLSPDFELVHRVRDIDPKVLSLLFHNAAASLADPGAPFSAGDAMLPGKNPPARRLVLAGKSASSWFILYEHGGIGLHTHIIVFSRISDQWRIVYAGRGLYEYDELSKLKAAVKAGKFEEFKDEL
jgi:hypothetical protein